MATSPAPSNKSVNLSDREGMFLAVRGVVANVEIDGPHARSKLVITFHNDLGKTIEGDLVFPLPPMAALRDLEVKIGLRTIQGKIKARQRAQAEYQRALDAGKSAAIGESEGEDLARMRIAPIDPGEDVEVSLTVDQLLVPISDGHRLIVPLTYMPRYVEQSSELNATEIAAVHRPRPLTLAARAKVDVRIEHPEEKPAILRCVSHKVATKAGEKVTLVELRDAPLDRDLQIEIADRPKGEKPGLWIRYEATKGADENGPTTTVAIVPPAFADEGPTIARSVIFLVDRSGSMRGAPMASAIRAVRGALRSLGPEDRFNIIVFDNHLEALAQAPVPFDDAALSAADAFIGLIDARGGTEASMAIEAALTPKLAKNVPLAISYAAPPDQHYRLKVVVFMTDGDVTGAAQVLKTAKDKLVDTRVHVLGIGDAVHHGMLAELAELGGGTYTPVSSNEDLERALVRLKNAITAPLWTGIKVLIERDGERRAPKMLEPPGAMDLFAAEPVLFSFRGPIEGGDRLVLVGQKAEGESEQIALELSVPANARAEGAATIWALLRNRRLTYRFDPADDETLEGLGTSFGVVNREVALVGVHSDQREKTIEGHVPVVLPQPQNMAQMGGVVPRVSGRGSAGFGPPRALRSPVFGPPPPPAAVYGAPPPPPPMGAPPPMAPPGFGPPPPPPGVRVSVSAPIARAASAPMAPRSPAPSPAMASIALTNDEGGLRALLLQQKADGLFAGDIGATLAAIAALVGRGHTAREGLFRAELRRTTTTLRSKRGGLSGNERLMALLALALLTMPHGDSAPEGLSAELAQRLEGISLADLADARTRIRAVMAAIPAGWEGTTLGGDIKRVFL